MALTVALAIVTSVEFASRGPSAVRVVQALVVAARGSAQLRLSGGHAELIVRHLASPPPGHIYEVWLRRGRRPPSPTGALFTVTAAGADNVDVPGDLRAVSQLTVTQEPAGGSLVPTAPPVIVVPLS